MTSATYDQGRTPVAMNRLVRYMWASPTTVVGLVVATLACYRGRIDLVAGAVEAHGPLLDWALRRLIPLHGGAEAMTLGHVVVGRSARVLAVTRAHERVHVEQYERWGPIFIPAYVASSVWAVMCGRHPYYDNVFEREAWECNIYRSTRTTRVLESSSNAR